MYKKRDEFRAHHIGRKVEVAQQSHLVEATGTSERTRRRKGKLSNPRTYLMES